MYRSSDRPKHTQFVLHPFAHQVAGWAEDLSGVKPFGVPGKGFAHTTVKASGKCSRMERNTALDDSSMLKELQLSQMHLGVSFAVLHSKHAS
ncbi:hypothetical protein GCM10008938_38810 [Deinococcus roseus]|uniref:Uncharacterized protein n=1 Tax=Deinococcus roseus TaxID=392414 RepID=A0ABQ2D7W6_9DEIO|nr:hypothetical protein GCM10008938_38810 [Deinococcus roseus]